MENPGLAHTGVLTYGHQMLIRSCGLGLHLLERLPQDLDPLIDLMFLNRQGWPETKRLFTATKDDNSARERPVPQFVPFLRCSEIKGTE